MDPARPEVDRRRPLPARVLCVLLLWSFVPMAVAAHITDKLVVGVYSEARAEGTPLRLIASGTPLEVLAQRDGFSQVRLTDDTRGWVESGYITEEKPAKAMLLETQARLRQQGMELAALREKAGEGALPSASVEALPSAREAQLRQSLDKAQTRIAELEGQLATLPRAQDAAAQLEALRARTAEALQLLADAQGVRLADYAPPTREGFFDRHERWIIGLGALLLGVAVGVAVIDYRIRKRYGGFRI